MKPNLICIMCGDPILDATGILGKCCSEQCAIDQRDDLWEPEPNVEPTFDEMDAREDELQRFKDLGSLLW